MSTSLAPAPAPCPKAANRPTHPWILHIEGHVEELAAIADDEKALARGAHVAHLIAGAEKRCVEILDQAKNMAEAVEAAGIQAQIIRLASRSCLELADRAKRLRAVVRPAVLECYRAAEDLYAADGLRPSA